MGERRNTGWLRRAIATVVLAVTAASGLAATSSSPAAAAPADGDLVVYADSTGIKVVRPDGSERTDVPFPERYYQKPVSWGPGGSVAYSCFDRPPHDVSSAMCLVDPHTGSVRHPFPPSEDQDVDLRMSPSGTRMLVTGFGHLKAYETGGRYLATLATGMRSGQPTEADWRPTSDPTINDSFIDAAYDDFLRRPPTHAERANARQQIAAFGRHGFLHSLGYSAEWVGALVDRYYQDTLGRPADPGGKAHWTDQILHRGATPATVAASFYASDEYFQRLGGGTISSWVTDLYRKLLDREPDPGGHRHWVDIATRHGRLAVARPFYQSIETRRARVDQLYRDLLDRPADPTGLANWTEEIGRTGNDVALAIDLAASQEYWEKANR